MPSQHIKKRPSAKSLVFAVLVLLLVAISVPSILIIAFVKVSNDIEVFVLKFQGLVTGLLAILAALIAFTGQFFIFRLNLLSSDRRLYEETAQRNFNLANSMYAESTATATTLASIHVALIEKAFDDNSGVTQLGRSGAYLSLSKIKIDTDNFFRNFGSRVGELGPVVSRAILNFYHSLDAWEREARTDYAHGEHFIVNARHLFLAGTKVLYRGGLASFLLERYLKACDRGRLIILDVPNATDDEKRGLAKSCRYDYENEKLIEGGGDASLMDEIHDAISKMPDRKF